MTIDEYIVTAKLIPTVVAYLLTEDGQVIMGKRKTEHGNGFISGLGGKIGDIEGLEKETADEALIRELEEEIGITPTQFKSYGLIKFLNPFKPHRNMQTIPYLITQWTGVIKKSTAILPVRFKLSEIPYDLMWKDNKIWVPKILARQVVFCTTLFGEDGEVQEYRFEKLNYSKQHRKS